MTPVYLDCSKESGKGTHERMKAHMSNYVHDEKHIIFDEASAAMIRRLTKLEVRDHKLLDQNLQSDLEYVSNPDTDSAVFFIKDLG